MTWLSGGCRAPSSTALQVPPDAMARLAATDEGRTSILLWNWTQPAQSSSNRPFFTKVLPSQPAPSVDLALTNLAAGTCRVTVRRTGFHSNDAQSRYLEMGSPKTLTARQLAELQASTSDRPETMRTVKVGHDGLYRMSLSMRTNDVVLASIDPVATC